MTIRSTRRQFTRREFLGTTASASALVLAGAAGIRPAYAQYPERNLTLIVPYGAGGGTDITARLLAKDLEPVIGKPVTVENRGGGGGWVGWGALAGAKPDGYTMGYLNVPSMYAGYLDPQIGRKERLESFTPIINHVIDYNVWAVKADSPFKTVKDVIDAAKKQPDTITVTAYGAGSDDHIAILGIEAETGTKFIVIHSKSTAEAKTQALGGHIHVLGANISEVARGGEGRAVPPARRHGAGALALPARCADLQGAGLQPGLVGDARHRDARQSGEGRAGQAHVSAGAGHQLEGASGARRAAQPRAAGDAGRGIS